ncbi:MAG TPA: hypothetical protein VFL15_08945 [Gammaproteobacteria bacterium]|nr:hypothetical protein [Gammaproteobacteria bacterium]
MKLKQRSKLMLMLLPALAACASTGGKYMAYQGHPDQITPAALAAVNSNHPEDVLCWRTAPVGSHLRQTYCATKQEVAANQQKDRDAYFWATTGTPKFSGPGG